jgi:dinuclear metal center YbgI/SA1388 family protein
MAKLNDIVAFLDENLGTAEVPDYPGAHNGLQLTNDGEVTKIACAVDASLAVIEDAVAQGADLLVVHHGLFWQGVQMWTGAQYRKMKSAIEGNLAIYSSHIPLDIHSQWGNNVLLAQEIGLKQNGTFLPWKGIELGVSGEWREGKAELLSKLESVVGPLKLSPEFGDSIGRLGMVTGGAGSEVAKVREAGIDTFITGEGPHWSFPCADELGLNVIHAGHYATETFGVRKLGEILAEHFQSSSCFLHHPTSL